MLKKLTNEVTDRENPLNWNILHSSFKPDSRYNRGTPKVQTENNTAHYLFLAPRISLLVAIVSTGAVCGSVAGRIVILVAALRWRLLLLLVMAVVRSCLL